MHPRRVWLFPRNVGAVILLIACAAVSIVPSASSSCSLTGAEYHCAAGQLTEFPSITIPPRATLLRLEQNLLTQLNVNSFARSPQLEEIHLEHNSIATIHSQAFFGLAKLRSLFLQNNHIAQLPASIFDASPQLRTLNLTSNRLVTLPSGVFRHFYSQASHIYLAKNPLQIGYHLCALVQYKTYMATKQPSSPASSLVLDSAQMTFFQTDVSTAVCSSDCSTISSALLSCNSGVQCRGTVGNHVCPETSALTTVKCGADKVPIKNGILIAVSNRTMAELFCKAGFLASDTSVFMCVADGAMNATFSGNGTCEVPKACATSYGIFVVMVPALSGFVVLVTCLTCLYCRCSDKQKEAAQMKMVTRRRELSSKTSNLSEQSMANASDTNATASAVRPLYLPDQSIETVAASANLITTTRTAVDGDGDGRYVSRSSLTMGSEHRGSHSGSIVLPPERRSSTRSVAAAELPGARPESTGGSFRRNVSPVIARVAGTNKLASSTQSLPGGAAPPIPVRASQRELNVNSPLNTPRVSRLSLVSTTSSQRMVPSGFADDAPTSPGQYNGRFNFEPDRQSVQGGCEQTVQAGTSSSLLLASGGEDFTELDHSLNQEYCALNQFRNPGDAPDISHSRSSLFSSQLSPQASPHVSPRSSIHSLKGSASMSSISHLCNDDGSGDNPPPPMPRTEHSMRPGKNPPSAKPYDLFKRDQSLRKPLSKTISSPMEAQMKHPDGDSSMGAQLIPVSPRSTSMRRPKRSTELPAVPLRTNLDSSSTHHDDSPNEDRYGYLAPNTLESAMRPALPEKSR